MRGKTATGWSQQAKGIKDARNKWLSYLLVSNQKQSWAWNRDCSRSRGYGAWLHHEEHQRHHHRHRCDVKNGGSKGGQESPYSACPADFMMVDVAVWTSLPREEVGALL